MALIWQVERRREDEEMENVVRFERRVVERQVVERRVVERKEPVEWLVWEVMVEWRIV